jgi:hypothetical protein
VHVVGMQDGEFLRVHARSCLFFNGYKKMLTGKIVWLTLTLPISVLWFSIYFIQ